MSHLPKITRVVESAYHRNGVSGVGFLVTLFDSQDGRMVAIDFGKDSDRDAGGVVFAVFNVEQLAKGNIKMAGGNSWRGDNFADVLRPMYAPEYQSMNQLTEEI